MLNESRIENYSQWLEVGWVLHNIDPNSDELLDIWIDFSKKSDKFKEGECEKIWEKSKNEGLSLATLHYWAKIDNYPKYKEFRDKDVDNYIESSIKTQSNYDIAIVLYKMYEYDFVYCSEDWYIYKNHRWNRENDGMSLRQKISTELCDKYFRIISDYNKLAGSENITEEEKILASCNWVNGFYPVYINIFTNTCEVIIKLFLCELPARMYCENGYWFFNKMSKFF
jgi:hypothetical protein